VVSSDSRGSMPTSGHGRGHRRVSAALKYIGTGLLDGNFSDDVLDCRNIAVDANFLQNRNTEKQVRAFEKISINKACQTFIFHRSSTNCIAGAMCDGCWCGKKWSGTIESADHLRALKESGPEWWFESSPCRGDLRWPPCLVFLVGLARPTAARVR
jgi:hypothetical protein